ncbi:MAG: ester cyclase [Limisphaerales bacterium]
MGVSNKVLIFRWFEEVWNRKNEAVIEELLDSQALIYGLTDDPTRALRGPDEFRPFWRVFITAFPDLQIAVESTISEDDKVVARCAVRGTHTGEGLGFPPTGRRVHMNGIVIATIRNGKLVEGWNSFDFMSLYSQLGVMKSPADPAAKPS